MKNFGWSWGFCEVGWVDCGCLVGFCFLVELVYGVVFVVGF